MRRTRSRLTRAKSRWQRTSARWRWRIRWFVASRGGRRDPLTGLGTPRQFTRDLEVLAARGGALLAIDVFDMKFLNLQHGHRVGDLVLREIGARIRASAGANRTYRIKGGDFAVLMPGASGAEARALAERIVEALDPPTTVRPARPGDPPSVVPARVGIGCVTSPVDGETAAALMEAAGRALYEAKVRPLGEPWPSRQSVIAAARGPEPAALTGSVAYQRAFETVVAEGPGHRGKG